MRAFLKARRLWLLFLGVVPSRSASRMRQGNVGVNSGCCLQRLAGGLRLGVAVVSERLLMSQT